MRRVFGVVGCVLLLASLAWGQTQRTMMPQDYFNLYDPIVAHATACTAATMNTALTAIGASVRVFWLSPVNGAAAPCTWNLESNVTVAANVGLYRPTGVQVCPATGVTLTINGPLSGDWGSQFKGTGCAGTVVFGTTTPEVRAIWWGSTLNAATLNAALTDIGSAKKQVYLEAGAWAFNASVTTQTTTTLEFPTGFTCAISGGAVLTFNGPVVDRAHLGKTITPQVTVGNTTTETQVMSYTVNGCALSLHHAVRFVATFGYLNQSGSDANLLVNVKYGGITILQFNTTNLASSIFPRPVFLDVVLHQGATTTQGRAFGSMKVGGAVDLGGTSTTIQGAGGLETIAGNNNVGTNMTGDVPLTVTLTHSVATANVTATFQAATLELLNQ